VFALIGKGLHTEWDHAEEWSRHVPNYVSYDVAEMIEPPLFEHEGIREEFIDSFMNWAFCERDPYGLNEDEAYMVGWDGFSEVVKHQTRYLFEHEARPAESGHWSTEGLQLHDVLNTVGDTCRSLGLVRQLPPDTSLYRARTSCHGTPYTTAAGLGTAPAESHLVENRMSPAGIPMFYCAFDPQVAIDEIWDPANGTSRRELSVGRFVASRPLTIIDFTQLPDVPSLFDEALRPERPKKRFLWRFTWAISQPVVKENRQHIDYVPTQILSEYFRLAFRYDGALPIDGIVYPSAASRGTGDSVVVFAKHEQCVDVGQARFGDSFHLVLQDSEVHPPPEAQPRINK